LEAAEDGWEEEEGIGFSSSMHGKPVEAGADRETAKLGAQLRIPSEDNGSANAQKAMSQLLTPYWACNDDAHLKLNSR
jgi:hypothetical protein